MAFNPTLSPYGGAGVGNFQKPDAYSPGPNFGGSGLGAGIPDSQQSAPGTPTTAQTAPGSPEAPRTTGPSPRGFSAGGAIPDPGSEGDLGEGSAPDDGHNENIMAAMDTVKNALAYGRQLHGIGGGDQANAMPMRPGSQSESGIPPDRPQPPGPQANAMPMRPGNQSESGIPPARPQPPQTLAAAMPMRPGSQSESGIPPDRPQPPVAENEDEDNGTG